MATTRFKGETAGERLDLSGISDDDMIQLRHKPGTIDDADKGISKSQLLSCPFGVSDTAAATAAKAASLTDSNPDFTLVSGREVVVCFTTANSASNPTLNFAGSGAIPIYYPNGQTVGAWPAETWMHLKYFYATVGNSTIQRWILLSDLPVDTVAANNMHSVTSNAVNNALNAVRINVTDFITLSDGFTVGENAIYKLNNHIFGYLCLLCDGSWQNDTEILFGSIKPPYISALMNRGISGWCGAHEYDSYGFLYVATSANSNLRGGLFGQNLPSTNKKYIKFNIDYIC